MFSDEYSEMLRTLEVHQLIAIEQLLKRQQKQTFCGISAEIMVSDFVELNTLKKEDPIKALLREKRLLAMCYGENNEKP